MPGLADLQPHESHSSDSLCRLSQQSKAGHACKSWPLAIKTAKGKTNMLRAIVQYLPLFVMEIVINVKTLISRLTMSVIKKISVMQVTQFRVKQPPKVIRKTITMVKINIVKDVINKTDVGTPTNPRPP